MSSRSKEEWKVIACLFFVLFVGVADSQLLSPLLPSIRSQFGASSSDMGLLFTGYAFCAGLSVLIWGPLSDIFGRRQGLLAGSIADRIGKRFQFILSNLSLALLLFILPGMRWGPALFGVFGIISLSAAFCQGPMEAVLTVMAPSATRGTFVALKNSFSQLGIGLATMLSGILFEWRGYAAVCFLGAGANLLAVLGMLFTYKKRDL